MTKKVMILPGMLLAIALAAPAVDGQTQAISTNKDKLLTIAVQGKVAPAAPDTSYTVTWDGKPQMTIGRGGINYGLKIGDNVFGPAAADRATVGVATVATGEGNFAGAYLNYTSVGNEVRILGGDARGEKGVVVGKFGGYILVHFDDAVLDRLSIGDTLQVKARGTGLQINGFDDVIAHSVAPEILEHFVTQNGEGKLEARVVKEIPAEIVGQGAGRGALTDVYNIQTCYPPDIEEYGLEELRYGDLVLLKDQQTDYGKGFYKGGATLGIVSCGPSNFPGLGIGVTALLSSRSGKLAARIDPAANIAQYLGIRRSQPTTNSGNNGGTKANVNANASANANVPADGSPLKTNKDKLLTIAVEGVVQPPRSGGYRTDYDGTPKVTLGMASINYTVSLGDPAYGWANADHVEPDVTIQGRDRPSPSDCALAILACIGNEAKVVSGEAKGAKGYFIGRHAGSDDLVWFPKNVLEQLALNDRIQVKARGVGLKIEGFEDVRVNKMSPELLENMGIAVEEGQLVVPVVLEIPGHIMGSGMGFSPLESLDYDIQTTDPATVEEYGLTKLRLGDIVAIRDHYNVYGPGRYEGAVTIGTVIHGWSGSAGHGPGVNTLLSAKPGKIKTRIDPHANTAYYLGIKERPRSGSED